MLIPLDIFKDILTDNCAQMRVASSQKQESGFMGVALATSSLLLVGFQICKRLSEEATEHADATAPLQFARELSQDALAADLSRSVNDVAAHILEAVQVAEADVAKRWEE